MAVPYWVIQFGGAICAALFLQLMFGDVSAGECCMRSTRLAWGGAGMRRQGPEPAGGQRQEHLTMTAEQPQSPITEGIHSLEVRWIFPGQPTWRSSRPRLTGSSGSMPARTRCPASW